MIRSTVPHQPPVNRRLAFIDQCRGYAIFGMIFVNLLGMFDRMPWLLKHHTIGLSYADTIAPLFIFVVGMGFHLSFRNTMQREGLSRARKRAARRYAILMGMGLVFGGFHLRAAVWDALMDIGASGMLALPVMHCSMGVRIVLAFAYLGTYQLLYSWTGYGAWVIENSINGGPLGPLSWVFILLMGTVAFDVVSATRPKRMMLWFSCLAMMLLLAGWSLRVEWPGVKAFWPFSQFGMSAPYPVFAAGLCFATVLLFYLCCEVLHLRVPHLTTLGKNPLVLYLLQGALVVVAQVLVPKDIAVTTACVLFLAVYGVCYGTAKHLDNKGIIIKI